MDSSAITKIWAILALATALVAAIIPRSIYDAAIVHSAYGPFVSAFIALMVGSFYLFMLWQCVMGRGISRKWPWLLLFALLPILSAFIYYFGAYERSEAGKLIGRTQ